MNTQAHSDLIHQRINTSMTEASLHAIRTAMFHGTEMVVQLDGRIQTIRPEQHPLYAQAMRKDTQTPHS